MVYIPSILAVGFYFEKRRALANGITMAGSGIGTFIYAPLSNYLQDKYSWRGALLILSGIVLHCIAFGALYRPLRVRRKVKLSPSEDLKLVEQCNVTDVDLKSLSHGNIPKIVEPNGTCSHDNIPKSTNSSKLKFPKGLSLHAINNHEESTFQSAILFSSRLEDLKQSPLVHSQPILAKQERLYICNQPLKPLERKDIFYSGSLYRIPQYNEEGIGSLTKLDNAIQLEENSRMSKLAELKKTFMQVAGLTLLKNPVFILIMMSSVLWTSKFISTKPNCLFSFKGPLSSQ